MNFQRSIFSDIEVNPSSTFLAMVSILICSPVIDNRSLAVFAIGTAIQKSKYKSTVDPPAMTPNANAIRTHNESSTPRYAAIPPQTPATRLSSGCRNNFLPGFIPHFASVFFDHESAIAWLKS